METLILKTPIFINGVEITELTYDITQITIEQFGEAEARKFKVGSASVKGATLELDYSMQVYIGMAAILAVNLNYDFNDLERIKGLDLVELYRIGRNFTAGREGTGLPEETSEEDSETTPAPSTPPLTLSKKNQSASSLETTEKP